MYSAVEKMPDKVVSKLSLAKTKTPWLKETWDRQGEVFPNIPWSKSGALLFRDELPHYLIWGDLYLTIAETYDMKVFTNKAGKFLEPRATSWDKTLVESGPPPLKLEDGNYLFFYNSGRDDFPSEKPGYSYQYNVGFLILDKDDPTKILQRSENPILSPELAWEKGKAPFLDLTPNVVFLEGAKALGNNQYLVFYGGADSVIGTGLVTVTLGETEIQEEQTS